MKQAETSWLLRGVNALGKRAPSGWGFKRPLEPAELFEQAHQRTGLDDLGDPGLEESINRLINSLEGEAGLSPFGRLAAHADLLQLLVNRLHLTADRERHPGIRKQRIIRPVFITGLPRSGSTLLHQLLSLDERHRAPLTWEVRRPSPPPGLSDGRRDGRIRATARELRWFARLAPQFKRIHPLGAELPQECIDILSHSFASPRFHTNYFVPSYQAWLDTLDQTPAYVWHQRFLQHLQWQGDPRQWVLKAPAHMFALKALLGVYPDAVVVQTHRDPREVIGSMVSMTVTLQRVFSDRVDPQAVAAEVISRWSTMLEREMRVRQRTEHDSGNNFFDVAYPEFIDAPLETVAALYRHLGLHLTEKTRARMVAWLKRNPQHRHGVHHYSLAEFGLDSDEAVSRFAAYTRTFPGTLRVPGRG